jgi:glycosyltransferase involved in cell wall biosynthesis
MNVGIVIQYNFPAEREVRTRKFAKVLDERGNDVTVYSRNTTRDPARGTVKSELDPRTERLEYADVHRFTWFARTRFGHVVTAALPFNPFWVLWLLLQFYRDDINRLVACELRAGLPTIVAGKLLGVPVVVDVRENYPAFAGTLPRENLLGHLAYHPWVVDRLERLTARLADGVVVVADVRARQFADKGVDPEKIVRVMNTPFLSESRVRHLLKENSEPARGQVVRLVYLGVIREGRGLQSIIRALPLFEETGVSVEFHVAGDGPFVPALKRLADELGVEESVTFEGYIDSDRVPTFLRSGTIGVIPHELNSHWRNTVPNKLFDYMSAGLPVVATDTPPVRELVERIGCGAIVPASTSRDEVRDTIVDVARRDTDMVGRRGRQAVREEFNWTTQTEPLLGLLDDLERR